MWSGVFVNPSVVVRSFIRCLTSDFIYSVNTECILTHSWAARWSSHITTEGFVVKLVCWHDYRFKHVILSKLLWLSLMQQHHSWFLDTERDRRGRLGERRKTTHLEHDPVLLLRFVNHTHVAPHRDFWHVAGRCRCRWTLLTPALCLLRSLFLLVGEPHPHSQCCGVSDHSSEEDKRTHCSSQVKCSSPAWNWKKRSFVRFCLHCLQKRWSFKSPAHFICCKMN